MKNVNKYQYVIKSTDDEFVVEPLGEKNFNISYTKDGDLMHYDKQLTGWMVFRFESFERIMEIENSVNRCSSLYLEISRICDKTQVPIYEGKMNLNNAEFDLDRCEIRIQYEQQNEFSCIEEEHEFNLFDHVDSDNKVIFSNDEGTFETIELTIVRNTTTFPRGWDELEYAQRIPTAYENQGYVVLEWVATEIVHFFTGLETEINITLIRQVVDIPCENIAPHNYILAEDNCIIDGTRKYYVAPTPLKKDLNIQQIEPSFPEIEVTQTTYKATIIGYDISTITFDNGMKLNDVLEFLCMECGLNYHSDFFTNEINPITGVESYTNNLILYQMSDVIRYDDSYENATIANITLANLLENLVTTFNVDYGVIDGLFRIEHHEWFREREIVDLTIPEFSKFTNKKRKYKYDTNKFPKSETWQHDKQGSPLWEINDITYSDCNAVSGEDAEIKTTEFTTDILFLVSNYENERVSEKDLKGFALISGTATAKDDEFHNTNANNDLSWFSLLQDFHFHNRPLKYGIFSQREYEFRSTKLSVLGEQFSIPFCLCDFENFNIFAKYQTALGVGYINKADISLTNEYITLEIAYPYDMFQTQGIRDIMPVLFPRNFDLESGETFYALIDAEDEDGFIANIEIVESPQNGQLMITRDLNDFYFHYKANNAFIGFDTFKLQAIDNNGNRSNVAEFRANVIPIEGSDYPTLYPEEYETTHPMIGGEYLVGNVLDNDIPNSPLGILTIVNYEQTSRRTGEPDAEFRIEPEGDMYVTFNGRPTAFQFKYSAINDSGYTSEQYSRHKFKNIQGNPRN